MIILFWGLFIHGKGAVFWCLNRCFKIALKCNCFPRLRLSSFYAAGRGGLKSQEEWTGRQLVCGEEWRILYLRSGKAVLSVGTLTVLLADGFLVCSPGMIGL